LRHSHTASAVGEAIAAGSQAGMRGEVVGKKTESMGMMSPEFERFMAFNRLV
jgi:hypothetical protein